LLATKYGTQDWCRPSGDAGLGEASLRRSCSGTSRTGRGFFLDREALERVAYIDTR
jgi:hypothetical protein